MSIKQISVFVENRHGRLADITRLLAEEGIDIRALSIADTTDYGVLRMIVNDTAKAKDVFKVNGFAVTVTEVVGIEVPDVPGGFNKVVEALCSKGIDIEYTYAFLSPKENTACVIIRVEDNCAAKEALLSADITLLDEKTAFSK